jgi:putative membrane protein
LTDLAKQKGVSLPAEPADAPNDKVSDPDRIAGLLKAHEDAVALFHKEAVRGTDPDVKTFAQTVLPTLQRRLVVLRSLQEQYPPRAG